jgi:hypothetical protein
MDIVTALNSQVKPGLSDTFGIAMANMIILQCSQKAGVSMMGLDSAGYLKLVNAIVSDDRVVQMLGRAGAQAKRDAWSSAVK